MTQISPAWWCPDCKKPVMRYREPCECGHEFVASWKCSNCGEISVDFECQCGFNRQKEVRNKRLIRNLEKVLSRTGQTVLQRLYKHVMFHGYNRRIPSWVVEEAWGSALEKLVNVIDRYDPEKGEFEQWAFPVVRNELLNAARADAQEAKHIWASMDYENDDDSLLAEQLGPCESALDLLLSKEERIVKLLSMRQLAMRHLGTYTVYEDGKEVEKPLYLACIDAYLKVGRHGWIKAASEATGVPEWTIIRRRDAIRQVWEKWQAKDQT